MPSFALASSSRATDSSWSPAWWASSPRDRRSRTSSRVDASSSATLASSSSAWYDSADGGDAGAGDLHVLVGLDAGDADGAGHLAVHQHRHAAGQQRLHGRGDEGGTAAVDHLLEGLGLAAADGGVAGLLGGDIGAEGRGGVHAAQAEQVAAVVGQGQYGLCLHGELLGWDCRIWPAMSFTGDKPSGGAGLPGAL